MTRSPPPPALHVEDVVKSYGRFRALDGVSLAVAEGEFVCFLGPSGCGKTTLLRVVAGLERQSAGRVFQRGVDVSDRPPAARDFGIVFQSYALFPNLTVARNVAYGLEHGPRAARRPRGAIAARVDELLDLVGLADQAAKYPAQLSGGQQQRVALARALASSPGLLLLDEPLSALDAKVRQRLRGEIQNLQRRLGVTTVMVTHDQEEALSVADRIVVMNRGRIEQVGTPAEIYARPATSFVAGFVGAANFLAGHRTPDGRLRLGPPNGAGGEPLTLCLRPEDVACEPADEGAAGPDVLIGTVAGAEFLGPVYRTRVAVPRLAAEPILADLPAAHALGLGLEPGRRVRIRVAEDRLRAFPVDAGPVDAGPVA
ncbi:putative 2-aminoethylphosphonate ABC transporter ATP-binding protein [Azospirillum sp. ST 5-10]|uniref:putative 2-aminoethylphosphonate ABC transporter ATP-binding protein n=1 Tax=unclassified Azospirillum TaxID=2630922 RepID=UPI003F4A4076